MSDGAEMYGQWMLHSMIGSGWGGSREGPRRAAKCVALLILLFALVPLALVWVPVTEPSAQPFVGAAAYKGDPLATVGDRLASKRGTARAVLSTSQKPAKRVKG